MTSYTNTYKAEKRQQKGSNRVTEVESKCSCLSIDRRFIHSLLAQSDRSCNWRAIHY